MSDPIVTFSDTLKSDTGMVQDSIPYDVKYGPLIECLASRNQGTWLDSYPPQIARHFQQIDANVLKDYMTELERDFNELFALALPIALNDIDLAQRLVRSKDALIRFKRLLRRGRHSKQENVHLNLLGLLKNMQDLQFLVLRPGV